MNDDKKHDDSERSPFKNPMFIFLIIAIIGTFVMNMIITSYTVNKQEEIPYNEFLNMVKDGEVDEVVIQADRIVIYEKAPEVEADAPGVSAEVLEAGADLPETGAEAAERPAMRFCSAPAKR